MYSLLPVSRSLVSSFAKYTTLLHVSIWNPRDRPLKHLGALATTSKGRIVSTLRLYNGITTRSDMDSLIFLFLRSWVEILPLTRRRDMVQFFVTLWLGAMRIDSVDRDLVSFLITTVSFRSELDDGMEWDLDVGKICLRKVVEVCVS